MRLKLILACAAPLLVALTTTACGSDDDSESTPGRGQDAKQATSTDGGLPTGDYTCYTYGGSGGNIKVTVDGSEYTTSSGTGEYSVDSSGAVEFTSGPWTIWNGAVLSDTTFGLTDEDPAEFYSITCNLES